MGAQVAIVGGGPVGLGLAIDLALKGIQSHVLERSDTLHQIPKGQNLTQRTGEHFRAWDITDAVRDATPIPRSFGNAGLVTYGTLLSDYHYDWFQRARVAPYYFAENERLPQFRLEAVMRARARALPEITFETGCKVTDVTQSADNVTLSYDQDGTAKTLTATYAVGCDGARSKVRAAAGITQATDHQGPRMALLVFRSKELAEITDRFPGKSIFNVMNPDLDGYWQFLGRVDLEGGWFYHAPVPDEAAGEDYFRAHLHEMVGQPFELAFSHIGFWDLRISHATTYRAGRIFIAGDAAHSHPPYGGYGVNTGLEDARNLGWKLAATLHGWAGPDLLDSYTAERHPVFHSTSRDFIERMITDFRDFLGAHNPDRDKADFEAAWAKRASGEDADVTQFLPHYEGSPIVAGPPGATSGAKGAHRVTAQSGHHLAPQALPDGRDLWDAMGDGFTLLDLMGDVDVLNGTAPMTVIRAPSAELRESYGAEIILIRPDQFIAYAGPAAGADLPRLLDHARGA